MNKKETFFLSERGNVALENSPVAEKVVEFSHFSTIYEREPEKILSTWNFLTKNDFKSEIKMGNWNSIWKLKWRGEYSLSKFAFSNSLFVHLNRAKYQKAFSRVGIYIYSYFFFALIDDHNYEHMNLRA